MGLDRNVYILGAGFSANAGIPLMNNFIQCARELFYRYDSPLDEDENSEYTVNIVNEIIEQSFNKLNEHIINQQRRKKGLMPANVILTRGAGIEIPKIKKLRGGKYFI